MSTASTPAPREVFSASARPDDGITDPAAQKAAMDAKIEKLQAEHTNNQRPAPGDTPLQLGEKLLTLSCIYEPEAVHGKIIDQLLALGADVHFRGSGNRTPIIAAAEADNAPLVKKLLAHGANPNDSDNPFNDTDKLGPALCHAACRKRTESVRLLLAAGADPNAECLPGGRTALTLAIDYARVKNEKQHNDIVAILVEAGADTNKGPQGGFTPLLFALASEMPMTAQYLLDHGADPELQPEGKAAPLEIAQWRLPESQPVIAGAIAGKHEKIRVAREQQDHLDRWIKDGCPTHAAARPMATLKLKPRRR